MLYLIRIYFGPIMFSCNLVFNEFDIVNHYRSEQILKKF